MTKLKIKPETWVELNSELAGMFLEYKAIDPIWVEDENGDERYTEDAQDEFNHISDMVEEIMCQFFERGDVGQDPELIDCLDWTKKIREDAEAGALVLHTRKYFEEQNNE